METNKKLSDYDKLKIEQWERHLARAGELRSYAIRRIDLLIISISGACIYVAFQILQFLVSPNASSIHSSTLLLKLSAVSAVIAIAVNFASQITGYHANKNDYLLSRLKIKELEKSEIDQSLLEKYDKTSKTCSWWTNAFNILSTIFMTAGIIILVIFNLITF